MELYRLNQYKKRTRFSLNEIIVYEDHAEILIYDSKQEEIAKAIIDVDDVDKVKDIKWCYDRYVRNTTMKILLHRLITNCSDDYVVDHINGNVLDNRKSNLRFCSISQNAMNQKLSSRNKSGHKGIFWDKNRNKWRVTISINKRPVMVGRYDTIEEALMARDEAEDRYYQDYKYKGGGR